MTATNSPGSALTLEQWRLIEQLSQSLTAEQARWISGYFAGLDAGLMRAGQQPTALAASAARRLTIVYGSETGNSTELARALSEAATAKGLTANLAAMADYKVRQLCPEKGLLVIISNSGAGDPPQPATAFFEFVQAPPT